VRKIALAIDICPQLAKLGDRGTRRRSICRRSAAVGAVICGSVICGFVICGSVVATGRQLLWRRRLRRGGVPRMHRLDGVIDTAAPAMLGVALWGLLVQVGGVAKH